MELSVIKEEAEQSATQVGADSDDSPRSRLCDCVGVVCSCACAVHCAAMPFVIGWLPALGLSWLADEGFHQWMVGICFLMAIAAVLPGYRRHRRKLVPLLAIAGVSVLATGAFAVPDECCRQDVAAADACTGTGDECCEASHESSESASTEVPACCKHDEHEANQDAGAKLTSASVSSAAADTAANSAKPACCEDHAGCEHGSSHNDGTTKVLSNLASSDATQNELNVVTAGASLSGLSAADASGANGWLDWLASLLTPLGGCLLVAAHLMNRRCCDCCERPA